MSCRYCIVVFLVWSTSGSVDRLSYVITHNQTIICDLLGFIFILPAISVPTKFFFRCRQVKNTPPSRPCTKITSTSCVFLVLPRGCKMYKLLGYWASLSASKFASALAAGIEIRISLWLDQDDKTPIQPNVSTEFEYIHWFSKKRSHQIYRKVQANFYCSSYRTRFGTILSSH